MENVCPHVTVRLDVKTFPRQRKTTGRVMREFKHGELEAGRKAPK
jgi:hypothetical protein